MQQIKTSGAKGKMQPRPGTPPGMEVDNHGNPIPFNQRTEEHKREAIHADTVDAVPARE